MLLIFNPNRTMNYVFIVNVFFTMSYRSVHYIVIIFSWIPKPESSSAVYFAIFVEPHALYIVSNVVGPTLKQAIFFFHVMIKHFSSTLSTIYCTQYARNKYILKSY